MWHQARLAIVAILFANAFPIMIQNSAFAYYGSCSEPSKPSCVDYLSINHDKFSMDMCRADIDSYSRRIKEYIECIRSELEQESTEQTGKLNKVVRRYNCYARGEKFCL